MPLHISLREDLDRRPTVVSQSGERIYRDLSRTGRSCQAQLYRRQGEVIPGEIAFRGVYPPDVFQRI